MAFGINILNTPAQIKKLPIQEPAQQAGINQLFQQGLQNFNPDTLEKYSRQQFAKQLPGIAERLNMLSGGQQRGQASNYELGSLQSNLEAQLAAQRASRGLQQLQLGLTPQFEYLYQPEQPGLAQTAVQETLGGLAANAPNLVSKAFEALSTRGRQQPAQAVTGATSTTTPTGLTATENAAKTTEQVLNNLTTPMTQKPLTAADLVAPSTGNIAQDAFNNPSLTPFTRQALAKTQIQQTPESAKVLEKIAQPSKAWQVGGNLGSNALQTAGWVAAGVPAPIALAGGVLKTGYDIYKTLRG